MSLVLVGFVCAIEPRSLIESSLVSKAMSSWLVLGVGGGLLSFVLVPSVRLLSGGVFLSVPGVTGMVV